MMIEAFTFVASVILLFQQCFMVQVLADEYVVQLVVALF